LPPDSPDFNPIEGILLAIKARWFNNHICKNEEKLLERLDQAILDIIDYQDPSIHRYRYFIWTNALADTD
jgi:transposase